MGEVGWRVWRIDVAEDGAVLAGISRKGQWDDRVLRAACEPPLDPFERRAWYRWRRLQPEHGSPSEICECGVSVYFDRADAESDMTLGAGTLRVVGPVEFGARTLVEERFARAREAHMLGPLRLVGECGMGTNCGIPTRFDPSRGLRCVAHDTPDSVELSDHVWAVGQQLERRYGVVVEPL